MGFLGRTAVEVLAGILVLTGSLYVFVTDHYGHTGGFIGCSKMPTTRHFSPNRVLVAWQVRTDCDSPSRFESQIWLSEVGSGVSGQVVFASPATYRDPYSGKTREVELALFWHSDDLLEVIHPPAVTPRIAGYDYRQKAMRVQVTSTATAASAGFAAGGGPQISRAGTHDQGHP